MLLFPSQVLLNSCGSRKTTAFFYLAIHHFEVHLEAEGGGQFETFGVVTYVKTANYELSVGVLADHGLHVDDRHVLGEVFACVVQDATDRRVGAPHHALHAVDRAQEVTAVDADRAAGADEDVLVVVGHTDDFVGNDLAYREDEVVTAVAQELIYLCWPGVVEFALADLVHELAGDFAQGDDVVAPVVRAKEGAWSCAEHGGDLFVGHGLVSA